MVLGRFSSRCHQCAARRKKRKVDRTHETRKNKQTHQRMNNESVSQMNSLLWSLIGQTAGVFYRMAQIRQTWVHNDTGSWSQLRIFDTFSKGCGCVAKWQPPGTGIYSGGNSAYRQERRARTAQGCGDRFAALVFLLKRREGR